MKHRMNMFKALTAALLLTANIAFAQTDASKEEIKKSDGLWGEFLDSIRNSKLSQKISLPSVELFRGIEIGGKYNFVSDTSVAQNYSGIDIWEIKAGVDSRIFGYDLPVHVGANASKKITYIQQFSNRKDSLLRVPYDPITKIPRSAADFFRRDKDNKLVFKTGDFIGYRIPLSFETSVGTAKTLAGDLLPINVGYRYFITGEFDIQIFRMTENQIRLKIIALNDKNRGWFGGVKIYAQDPVTSLIIERVLDDRVFSGSTTDRKTDLYIGDYVLNLESTEARALYDSIVAQKMKILNTDLLRQYITATQFLKDRRQFNENLFADLSQFNAIAAEDKNLPAEKRRVIKIINAENHTDADESSSTFNLIRLVKYKRDKNSSDAEIAVVGDSINDKEHFFLHSIGKNSKFSLFDNWKKEKRSQLNLLFKADPQGNKTEVVAVHFAKSREHYGLRQSKYLEFYETTGQHMPQEIKNKVPFPHVGGKIRDKYHNAYLNYELYVTTKIFELNQNLPHEVIDQRVSKLLSTISSLNGKVDEDEKNEIVKKLTDIFSNSVDLNNKFRLFDDLTMNNDIFSEYGLPIMINVINPETVSQCVLAQLAYSSHETGSSVLKYPSEEAFTRVNLFKNIIEQNNYILDRSYNLRNFLKEDGKPYSLPELMLKNEALTKQH
ncbi:MAG: hypothetical protein NDI63_00340 [Pseudobdellovibrio sp.]|nr:hypothetical protein [Pseudobdellovibrio sp.]